MIMKQNPVLDKYRKKMTVGEEHTVKNTHKNGFSYVHSKFVIASLFYSTSNNNYAVIIIV